MTVGKSRSISLAKVVWIGMGSMQEILPNVSYGVAKDFENKNRSNPQYAGGVLKTVSNGLRKENILHAYTAGNLK